MRTFNGIFCSWYNDVLAIFGQYDDVSVIRSTNMAFTAFVRIEELCKGLSDLTSPVDDLNNFV
jgi:hypothetical protein